MDGWMHRYIDVDEFGWIWIDRYMVIYVLLFIVFCFVYLFCISHFSYPVFILKRWNGNSFRKINQNWQYSGSCHRISSSLPCSAHSKITVCCWWIKYKKYSKKTGKITKIYLRFFFPPCYFVYYILTWIQSKRIVVIPWIHSIFSLFSIRYKFM